jgi:hypothetical protein
MPARVRKLLSCVLPTPPVHVTDEHQQGRELFASLADQGSAVMMRHTTINIESIVHSNSIQRAAVGDRWMLQMKEGKQLSSVAPPSAMHVHVLWQ